MRGVRTVTSAPASAGGSVQPAGTARCGAFLGVASGAIASKGARGRNVPEVRRRGAPHRTESP
jgi:hypothetical protein